MLFIWLHVTVWISTILSPCRTILNSWNVLPPQDEMKKIISKIKFEEVELTPMISCVESVTGRFIGKESVPIMVPSFLDNPGLSKLFLSVMQRNSPLELVVYSIAEDFPSSGEYLRSHNAVILIRNSTEFQLLGDLNKLCAPRCWYVICLLTIYKDENGFLDEAETMVTLAWKNWIIKTVIVASAGGKFLVAGTRGFEPGSYEVPRRPEILSECDAVDKQPSDRIFGKMIMNNSRVNVTLFDCPPYAFINENENKIVGIEGEIFEAIAKSLDISLNRLNISYDKKLNGSQYDVLTDLLENQEESDIVFCGLYLETSDIAEYTIPYEMEKVVWLVPSMPTLTLLGLVKPLQIFVWLAIIVLLIFTGLMKVLLFKKISFLGVLGLILGIALPRQPRILSNRIQFLSLVLFGYVITQSYLASLAGQLMNTNYQKIETMEELVNSGMMFGGTARHRDLFKIDESSISRRIYENYKTLSVSEYRETMAAVITGENRSIALVTELKISNSEIQPGPYDPHRLKEILARYPIALAVWRGLPFLDQINAKLSKLIESGLVSYWSIDYANHSSLNVQIEMSGALKMLHLSPSFLLLLLGHALGSIVFLIEIGIYVKRTNRFNKRRGKGKRKTK